MGLVNVFGCEKLSYALEGIDGGDGGDDICQEGPTRLRTSSWCGLVT
jgi:hypothetical protein